MHRFALKSAIAVLLGAFVASAQAIIAFEVPEVNISDPVQQVDGAWRYSYSLDNTTQCLLNCSDTIGGQSIDGFVLAIREFALPLFADAGVGLLSTPGGWQVQLVTTGNRFNLGAGVGEIVWTALGDGAGIARGATLGGFGYTAGYAAGKGPFFVSLGNGISMLGDPAIPLSPLALQAGIQPLASVPEPQSALLMLLGLAAAGAVARRQPALRGRISAG